MRLFWLCPNCGLESEYALTKPMTLVIEGWQECPRCYIGNAGRVKIVIAE